MLVTLLDFAGQRRPRRQSVDGEQLFGTAADQPIHVAHEAVDVSLAGRLVDDVLVVVVAHAAAQLLVVHLGLVLALAPASSNLVRVRHPELPAVARPRDDVAVRGVEQQFQKELPQLDRTAACSRTRNACRTQSTNDQYSADSASSPDFLPLSHHVSANEQ